MRKRLAVIVATLLALSIPALAHAPTVADADQCDEMYAEMKAAAKEDFDDCMAFALTVGGMNYALGCSAAYGASMTLANSAWAVCKVGS